MAVYDKYKNLQTGQTWKEINIPASIGQEIGSIGKDIGKIGDALCKAAEKRDENIKNNYKENIEILKFLSNFKGLNKKFDTEVDNYLKIDEQDNPAKTVGGDAMQKIWLYVYPFMFIAITLFNSGGGFVGALFIGLIAGAIVTVVISAPIAIPFAIMAANKAEKFVEKLSNDTKHLKAIAIGIGNIIQESKTITNKEMEEDLIKKIDEYINYSYNEDEVTYHKEVKEKEKQNNLTQKKQTESDIELQRTMDSIRAKDKKEKIKKTLKKVKTLEIEGNQLNKHEISFIASYDGFGENDGNYFFNDNVHCYEDKIVIKVENSEKVFARAK